MSRTLSQRLRISLAAALALPLSALAGGAPALAQSPSAEAAESPAAEAAQSPAAGSACVPTDPATPISFQLNFTAGGYNAPFALAEQEGYYDEVGLDVVIVKGQGSGTTARLVASGQAGLAYADASAVAQVIAQGAPIKILSTIYQSSPNAINALADSGITSVEDLRGKRLGEPTGEAGSALLPLLLEANGLTRDDLEIVPMPGTSLVGALTQGQVDAILGSTEGYNLVLEEQGFDVTVLPYAEWGVPTISTSIIASERFLEENANAVRCFIEASLRGWDEAIKRPDDAIAALVEYFPYDTRPELNLRQLESAIDLVCVNDAQFVGKAEPEAWERSVQIWQDYFQLSPDVPATEYYTYDYLPETLPTACPIA